MTTSWFTRPRLPARPALGAAILVAITVLLGPGRAQAHAHLVQADPAAGAVRGGAPPAGPPPPRRAGGAPRGPRAGAVSAWTWRR
ncbi:MAG: hypothetical protein NVSMB65_16520 [Chloroflexota bacterium]